MNAQRDTDWRCIMAVISREVIWDLVTWRVKRLFQRSTRLRSDGEIRFEGERRRVISGAYLSPSVSAAATNISWGVALPDGWAWGYTNEPLQGLASVNCSEGGGMNASGLVGKRKDIGSRETGRAEEA